MPNVTFIEADGTKVEVDATNGDSLMEAAVNAGIDSIAADCGGSCTCATCHCFIDEAWIEKVGAPNEFEEPMLDLTEAERQPGSRLSCQVTVSDELEGMIVRLPE